tara:strand:+ start:496 stop:918 length:423 start_codon:yes stop_codon:yes gene_type:complete
MLQKIKEIFRSFNPERSVLVVEKINVVMLTQKHNGNTVRNVDPAQVSNAIRFVQTSRKALSVREASLAMEHIVEKNLNHLRVGMVMIVQMSVGRTEYYMASVTLSTQGKVTLTTSLVPGEGCRFKIEKQVFDASFKYGYH